MLIVLPAWQTKMEEEIREKLKRELWGIVGDYNLNSHVFSDSNTIKEAIEEIISALIMIKKNATPEHTKEELKQFKKMESLSRKGGSPEPQGQGRKATFSSSSHEVTTSAPKREYPHDRNPMYYCMNYGCVKYLGFRGFCSKKCHNEFYDIEGGPKMTKKEGLLQRIRELDELAGKFIIGHKKLSQRQEQILIRIENLKKERNKLINRADRIYNLIQVMYGEVVKCNSKEAKQG